MKENKTIAEFMGMEYGVPKEHPNGYWDKITYWNGKLTEAILSKNLRGVDSAHRKLDYFIGREWETKQIINKKYK